MTVSTTTARIAYAGNGSTTRFTIPFFFLADADLRVLRRSALGTETALALTTHYIVSGAGNPAGGAVTLFTAPATGETLTIVRDPVIPRATSARSTCSRWSRSALTTVSTGHSYWPNPTRRGSGHSGPAATASPGLRRVRSPRMP